VAKKKIISAEDFTADIVETSQEPVQDEVQESEQNMKQEPVQETEPIVAEDTPQEVEKTSTDSNSVEPETVTEEKVDVPTQEVEPTTETVEPTKVEPTNVVTEEKVAKEEKAAKEVKPNADEVQRVQRNGTETAIREVDPTKNAKLQKRMKEKKTTVSIGKFKLSKKVLYVAVPVAIIALMLIVKGISSKVGGNKDENYFSILDSILQTEQGQFTYTIDVRTKAVEEVTKTTESTSNLDEVNNIEGMSEEDIASTTTEIVTKNQFTDSWGTADDVKVFSWQYPSYKIVIDGVCNRVDHDNDPSTDPLYETDIKVSLATVGHNDVITEIIAKDGKYYIDFNSLGVWLRGSKDAYLMSLGADIPEGAKYVVIDQEDFRIPSRYAEENEIYVIEEGNGTVIRENCGATTDGLSDNIRKLNTLIYYLENNLTDCIGKECYSTSISEGGSTQHINIGSTTGKKIADKVKTLALNSSSVYDAYIDKLQANNLLDENQAKQMVREKDNFLYAINPLQVYFNTNNLDMTNLQAVGSARHYQSMGGENVAEADLRMQFQSDTKFYDIDLSLTRKLGADTKVELDTGNVIQLNQLFTGKNNVECFTFLLDKFNRVIDYLNPTCIQLSKQTAMSPDRISETIKQSLVDIVNSMPEQTGVYLTTLTVDKYIEIYKNLIDQKDLLMGTDKNNVLIVEDFLNTVNDITGGVIVEVPAEVEEVQIQYPELVYEDSDMKIIANYNQDLSNKNVYVVSATIMNKTENEVVLNLTNFSLRTLLDSTYSSNNNTVLRDIDNTWDETLTPQAVTLGASSYVDVDLYFAVNGDSGYMDMWYQPVDKDIIKLGVIVQE
jgi:hypothetical protein